MIAKVALLEEGQSLRGDEAEAMVYEAEARFATYLRERLITRIMEAMERDRRKGGPTRATSEEEALQVIKHVGEELSVAATALDAAAEALKNQPGCGLKANQAKQAATRAKQAHLGLVGTT